MTSAVFKLIVNDGKLDRIVMASKLLAQRIRTVMCARKHQGLVDVTPTIQDLERTHVVWINHHFKPYAAIAYEYNKVRQQSGSQAGGGSVVFSIPQFGDFFHDMVAVCRLSEFAWQPLQTPLRGTAVFPHDDIAPTPAVGNGATSHYYNLVDSLGNIIVPGNVANGPNNSLPYRNLARYCEYPANRMFKNVRFDVNGNPLDQYSYMVSTMLEKFTVQTEKRLGYDRLTGQEAPMEGYGPLTGSRVVDDDALNTPAGIKFSHPASTQGLFDGSTAGQVSNVVSLNQTTAQIDFSREKKYFLNGPQTPKPVQPELELWHKFKFWFNDDVRLSIASACIPYGQRFIQCDLARADEIINEYPGLYLETIREDVFAISATRFRTTRQKSYTPIMQRSESHWAENNLHIMELTLNINNIFVNPEIHDIYIARIGFSLVRVYREHIARTCQDSSDEKLLSQLKWPVEYMFVGLRPAYNDSTANPQRWRDWHRLHRVVDAYHEEPDNAEISPYVNGAPTSNDEARLSAHTSIIHSVTPCEYPLPVQPINGLSVSSHGITIYDQFSHVFYNAYKTYHYGGCAITTPKDPGAMFVNFALAPRRKYQPSGHVNISRARETYLKWLTSFVSGKTTAEVWAIAVALNFLLITDGSAVLRYST